MVDTFVVFISHFFRQFRPWHILHCVLLNTVCWPFVTIIWYYMIFMLRKITSFSECLRTRPTALSRWFKLMCNTWSKLYTFIYIKYWCNYMREDPSAILFLTIYFSCYFWTWESRENFVVYSIQTKPWPNPKDKQTQHNKSTKQW